MESNATNSGSSSGGGGLLRAQLPALLRHQDAPPALVACGAQDSAHPHPGHQGPVTRAARNRGRPRHGLRSPFLRDLPAPRLRAVHTVLLAVGGLRHEPGTRCPQTAALGSRSILRPWSPLRGPGRLPERSPGRRLLQPQSPKVARPQPGRLGHHAVQGSPPPAPRPPAPS